MPVASTAPLGAAPVDETPADQPPPGSRAGGDAVAAHGISWRRNLYAITAAQALAIVGFTLREPILPFYLKQLGATSTDEATRYAGFFGAAGGVTMAVSAPIWGAVGDRFGRKPMLIRSTLAATITVGLMGFATDAWHIVGLRFVEGAFTGTVTASTVLVATSAPRDKLGFNLGLVQTAVFAGAAFGPAIGGFTAAWLGYRATFSISAALLFAAMLIVALFVKEVFSRSERDASRAAHAGESRHDRWAWMVSPVMIAMLGVLFMVRFAQMGTRPVMPLYLQELGGFADDRAASLSGWMFGAAGVSSAVSAVYFGRRGDRVGHRRVLLWSTIGAGALYLPLAFVQSPWQLIALQAVFGIAAGGLIPAANAIVAQVTSSDRRGLTFGVTAMAGSVGAAIGPLLLSSAIAPAFGFGASFLVVAVLTLGLAGYLYRALGRLPAGA